MRQLYIKIDDITCDYCRMKISSELKKEKNIMNINFDGNIAEIDYVKSINKEKIIASINNLEYYTSLNYISENKKELKQNTKFLEFIIIFVSIILITFLLNKIIGFNIFNMIPNINSKTTYVMLFVSGLFTSIHCISMCGAINLTASISPEKNIRRPLLYNLGRLFSYTLLGGLVGLLGGVLSINEYVSGVIIIIASIFMVLMALNMMGIINLKLKKINFFSNTKANSSFVIGLLNGLMPCGPLQAMQIYALSTGSFIYGALSMFLFCLGTIPLMLIIGAISNILKNNYKQVLLKISTVLILILSLVMFNRGIVSMGFNISNIFSPNYALYLKSSIKEDYQYIEFDLSYSGYKDIVLQKGILVRMVINADKSSLTGCNNAIKSTALNINKEITFGQNIIEFIPNEEGTFIYTCWMSMLKNNIVVIDDIEFFKNNEIQNNGGMINENNESSKTSCDTGFVCN